VISKPRNDQHRQPKLLDLSASRMSRPREFASPRRQVAGVSRESGVNELDYDRLATCRHQPSCSVGERSRAFGALTQPGIPE